MTDYYLKDVHSYADSATGRLNAQEKAAKLEFAVTRHVGLHHRVYELSLEPAPDWDVFEKRLFELTPLEREALESKRLFGNKVVVGVDPASPDGDRDAVVVGKHTGDQFVLTDAAVLDPGQYVVDINEEGKLKLSNAHLGLVTPGHKMLNDEEASKVAAIKERGRSFIELIESCRRQTRIPDCTDPSIVHFREDAHDHKLQNALDRAEEAIMWAVKYITAGE